MSLAFFDMDGTLVNGDTNILTNTYFMQRGIVTEQMIDDLNEYGRRFFEGTIDINECVKHIAGALKGMPRDQLNELLETAVREAIVPNFKPGAIERVKFHLNRGDRVVIVTSTVDYLASQVAKALGFEDVIAAPMERIDGVITGNLIGTVPFQENKVARINTFLKENKLLLNDSYAYGDSINDLPMLMMCDHRYAVDPNELLLKSPEISKLIVEKWS